MHFGDPDPLSAGTAEDAALWGGASAGMGKVAILRLYTKPNTNDRKPPQQMRRVERSANRPDQTAGRSQGAERHHHRPHDNTRNSSALCDQKAHEPVRHAWYRRNIPVALLTASKVSAPIFIPPGPWVSRCRVSASAWSAVIACTDDRAGLMMSEALLVMVCAMYSILSGCLRLRGQAGASRMGGTTQSWGSGS